MTGNIIAAIFSWQSIGALLDSFEPAVIPVATKKLKGKKMFVNSKLMKMSTIIVFIGTLLMICLMIFCHSLFQTTTPLTSIPDTSSNQRSLVRFSVFKEQNYRLKFLTVFSLVTQLTLP